MSSRHQIPALTYRSRDLIAHNESEHGVKTHRIHCQAFDGSLLGRRVSYMLVQDPSSSSHGGSNGFVSFQRDSADKTVSSPKPQTKRLIRRARRRRPSSASL